MYYQQGDILLIKVDEVPSNAKAIARTKYGIVLAKGEATGHTHVITDVDCEAYTLADAFFIKCGKPTMLVHEEHSTITLDPGTWQVSHVREYDHFAEEARVVVD